MIGINHNSEYISQKLLDRHTEYAIYVYLDDGLVVYDPIAMVVDVPEFESSKSEFLNHYNELNGDNNYSFNDFEFYSENKNLIYRKMKINKNVNYNPTKI